MFKILDLAFVFFCGFHAIEGSQVFSFPRFGVLFPRIDAVLTGLQFAYHNLFLKLIKKLGPVDTAP